MYSAASERLSWVEKHSLNTTQDALTILYSLPYAVGDIDGEDTIYAGLRNYKYVLINNGKQFKRFHVPVLESLGII